MSARDRSLGWAARRGALAGAGILRARLGWDTRAVGGFATAVTGRPWPGCGRADLELVLRAYATLARRVRARFGPGGPDRSSP